MTVHVDPSALESTVASINCPSWTARTEMAARRVAATFRAEDT